MRVLLPGAGEGRHHPTSQEVSEKKKTGLNCETVFEKKKFRAEKY